MGKVRCRLAEDHEGRCMVQASDNGCGGSVWVIEIEGHNVVTETRLCLNHCADLKETMPIGRQSPCKASEGDDV